MRKLLTGAAFAAMLGWAGSAGATITISVGGEPTITDTVLLDGDDTGADKFILGLSDGGWTVQFRGEENIKEKTGGQAWIEGSDGSGITFLEVTTPGAMFTGLEFKINGPSGANKPDWSIVIHGIDNSSTTYTFDSIADYNPDLMFDGDAWFKVVASDNQLIKSVDIRTSGDVGMQQFRIGDVIGNPPGVPEPATWAMMILGFGAAGSMIRRRRHALA